MSDLNFAITEEEGNLIIQGLAQLPFGQVANLVAKIQQQYVAQKAADVAPVKPNEGEQA